MKKKLTISIIFIVFLALVGFLYFQIIIHEELNIVVQPLSDKGIFVGNSNKTLFDLGAGSHYHQEATRAIDGAWDYVRKGGYAYQAGRYEEAADAYQKAYLLDKGSRAVSGFDLSKAYEKLGRHGDAITQLNKMIQNGELSKLGIQDAKEMIARLLATKDNT